MAQRARLDVARSVRPPIRRQSAACVSSGSTDSAAGAAESAATTIAYNCSYHKVAPSCREEKLISIAERARTLRKDDTLFVDIFGAKLVQVEGPSNPRMARNKFVLVRLSSEV